MCGVFLIDSHFVVDCSKFFAGVLTALSAMIQLEIPHINVMSKMDLLNKKQIKQIDRWAFFSIDSDIIIIIFLKSFRDTVIKWSHTVVELVDNMGL